MALKALKSFLWYERKDELLESDSEHFEKWEAEGLIGELKLEPKKEEPKADLDFNNDGKVDKKDVSLAAKLMGKSRKKKKK